MNTIKIALLATVAGAALTSATLAADPIVMLDPTPVVNNFSGFDWEGVYGGLYVAGHSNPGAFGIGGNVGVNILLDPVLLGVEGDISWYTNNTWEGQAHARLGVLVTDDVLFYGLAGFGANSVTSTYIPVGVGLEVAVTDRLSLKGQYEYHWDTDNGAESAHVGKFGFNFHF
jgi:opacity protein-like surface antigen